jgi:hypothetical protein
MARHQKMEILQVYQVQQIGQHFLLDVEVPIAYLSAEILRAASLITAPLCLLS